MSPMIRNFLGGFVGGLFGLAFAFIYSPTIMPFACLGGFFLGYWHVTFFREVTRVLVYAALFVAALAGLFWVGGSATKDWAISTGSSLRKANYRAFGSSLVFPFRWAGSQIMRFLFFITQLSKVRDYANSHLYNKALVVKFTALSIYSAVMCALYIWLCFHIDVGDGAENFLVKFFGGMFYFLFAYGSIYFSMDIDRTEENRLRWYFKRMERIDRLGVVRVFFIELGSTLYNPIYILSVVATMIVVWGVAFIAFMVSVITILPVYALLRVSFKLVLRKQMWPGAIITTLTTVVCYAVLRSKGVDALVNPWLPAFFCGMLSGLLSAGYCELINRKVLSREGILNSLTKDGADVFFEFIDKAGSAYNRHVSEPIIGLFKPSLT